MDRRIRGLECAMVAPGSQPGLALIAGRVAGRLTSDAVRRAAEVVVARHPALRTRLVGGEMLIAEPAGAVPVHTRNPGVRPGDPRAPWERVIEEELRWPIDLVNGAAVRVVHVPEVGGSTVILAAHPALADGPSLQRLLDELLSAADAAGSLDPLDPVVEVPRAPAAIDAAPVPAAMRWAGPVLKRIWVRDVVACQRDPVLPSEGLGPVRSLCAFRRGTPHGLRRLRVAADRHDVTIGQIVVTAVAHAVGRARIEVEGTGAGGLGRVPLDVEVDLRNSAGAGLPADAIGLNRGAMRMVADHAPQASFWDAVRSTGRQLRSMVGWRIHLVPHVVMNGVDPGALLDDAGADPLLPGAPPTVSDLGRWSRAVDHGGFVLREVYSLQGATLRGSPLTVWARTLPDGLCLNALAAAPFVSRGTLERVTDTVLALCEQPPADAASFADLTPSTRAWGLSAARTGV